MSITREKHILGINKVINIIFDVLQTSLNGIVFALEAKDEYSSKHSVRVAQMCDRFAIILGVDGFDKRMLLAAASVHDIGKIGIPDAILLADRKLTDSEWDIMKTHSTLGADIIKKTEESNRELRPDKLVVPAIFFERMEQLELTIRHHHERWDGNGYPSHLIGDEIPMLSRIIALCDSTDAMMSNRRYRKALPLEVCRNEIRKNSGVMYDPKIAEIFIENWESIVLPVYEDDKN